MRNETHHLDFSNGTHVAVLLDFQKYKKTRDPRDIVRVKRTGPEITDEMLPQYKDWMHDLNSKVATIVNCNHGYVFVTRKEIQCFIYHPDGTKEEEPVPEEMKRHIRELGSEMK